MICRSPFEILEYGSTYWTASTCSYPSLPMVHVYCLRACLTLCSEVVMKNALQIIICRFHPYVCHPESKRPRRFGIYACQHLFRGGNSGIPLQAHPLLWTLGHLRSQTVSIHIKYLESRAFLMSFTVQLSSSTPLLHIQVQYQHHGAKRIHLQRSGRRVH